MLEIKTVGEPGGEVGYDMPCTVGDRFDQIETPALVIDLDAFERNVARMRVASEQMGVRLRAHAKTHKSAAIALYQMEAGGACGVCCQKVAEAEALVRGGVADILVSNEVIGEKKIERLARLAGRARMAVCVDDADNVADLSRIMARHGVSLDVLVEIDCGAGRCGVEPGASAVALAQAVDAAPHLVFAGIQAYHGKAQHIADPAERRAAIAASTEKAARTVSMLADVGLICRIVGGAGTGSFDLEGTSGLYTELQCGSYIFMDADYARIIGQGGGPLGGFEHALFVLTSVMSRAAPGRVVCDAGLKAHAVDSGLPTLFGRPDLAFSGISDEHGQIDDPAGTLRLGERLKLVPGHCDPTVNLHDWYVGLRGDRVETLWPVTARGKIW